LICPRRQENAQLTDLHGLSSFSASAGPTRSYVVLSGPALAGLCMDQVIGKLVESNGWGDQKSI
jgi:hypothetical protein